MAWPNDYEGQVYDPLWDEDEEDEDFWDDESTWDDDDEEDENFNF